MNVMRIAGTESDETGAAGDSLVAELRIRLDYETKLRNELDHKYK